MAGCLKRQAPCFLLSDFFIVSVSLYGVAKIYRQSSFIFSRFSFHRIERVGCIQYGSFIYIMYDDDAFLLTELHLLSSVLFAGLLDGHVCLVTVRRLLHLVWGGKSCHACDFFLAHPVFL